MAEKKWSVVRDSHYGGVESVKLFDDKRKAVAHFQDVLEKARRKAEKSGGIALYLSDDGMSFSYEEDGGKQYSLTVIETK